jgi:hypothetical protein
MSDIPLDMCIATKEVPLPYDLMELIFDYFTICKFMGCKGKGLIIPMQKGPYFHWDNNWMYADVVYNKCLRHAFQCSEFRSQEKGYAVCTQTCSAADARYEITEQVDGYCQVYCSDECYNKNGYAIHGSKISRRSEGW